MSKKKQTWNQGEDNAKSTITEKNVLDIYKRLEKRESVRSIAKQYGVTSPTISKIKNGQRWAHLHKNNPNKLKQITARIDTLTNKYRKLLTKINLKRNLSSKIEKHVKELDASAYILNCQIDRLKTRAYNIVSAPQL